MVFYYPDIKLLEKLSKEFYTHKYDIVEYFNTFIGYILM